MDEIDVKSNATPFQADGVFTGFQIELEGVRAVVQGGELPVGAVIELTVVGFFKRNLVMKSSTSRHDATLVESTNSSDQP